MNPIVISVILPNFNGQANLQRALKSFARQAQDICEIIIVDGKSNDKSHEIIERFCEQHSNAKWVREADKGISDAINIGLHHATGSYIGYLGNDDQLIDGILQTVANFGRLIDATTFYFDSYTYNIIENRCCYRHCPKIEFTRKNLYHYGTIVGLQDIFINKEIFSKYKYNINNKYSMDYELYLEMTTEPGIHVHLSQPATINLYGGNITQRLGLQQFYESISAALRQAKNRKEVLWTYIRLQGIKFTPLLIFGLLKTAFRTVTGSQSTMHKLEKDIFQRYKEL